MNFGIVGYGRFGKLWAKALSAFGPVTVCEKAFHMDHYLRNKAQNDA